MPALLTRVIPSSGETLPIVGMGTWRTFDVGAGASDRSRLAVILTTFVEMGGMLIDSSPMYGRSEQVVGDLAATLGLRDQLFIATKVWTSGREAGVRQMAASMQKLRAPRIDLLQVHNLVDVAAHLETLRAWKEEGRVRYVGVTHYTASRHDAVARVMMSYPLDFVQINYSVAERDAERTVLPLARDRGIAVLVNRPFAEGATFTRLRARPVPEWASEIGSSSWAELMLKFVISHPAVTCVIPATSDVDHLRQNMRAGSGRLPDGHMRARIVSAMS